MTQSTLEQLARQVGQHLLTHKLTLATAESCTGGGISYFITSVAGSSGWFDRGFVTYSNQAKIDMLGVQQATLDQHGAVSEEVAREMAEGALRHSTADVSVAVTGIAGPEGGSKDKPVGTVWVAWAHKNKDTHAAVFHLDKDRATVRHDTIKVALNHFSSD